MQDEDPETTAPAALPVVVHVSEDDPELGLDVTAWRNGDRAARERLVGNLGGRLLAVVEHVAPGREPGVAATAVRRAMDTAASGGLARPTAAGPDAAAPSPTPAQWNRQPGSVAASLALWHLARLLGAEPTSFTGDAGNLGLAQQTALRLIDVDLATSSQVGELWGCNPNDVMDLHREARLALGMDDPTRSLCPSWPAVRTSHLATAGERTEATWHVMDCQPCTMAIAETAARRTRLLRLLPPRTARQTLLPGVGQVMRAFLAIPPLDQLNVDGTANPESPGVGGEQGGDSPSGR